MHQRIGLVQQVFSPCFCGFKCKKACRQQRSEHASRGQGLKRQSDEGHAVVAAAFQPVPENILHLLTLLWRESGPDHEGRREP